MQETARELREAGAIVADVLPVAAWLDSPAGHFTSLQQALTTAVPPAIRCQPSAASRDGSQLALEREEA